MLELLFNNDYTILKGYCEPHIYEGIKNVCSYYVVNAEWSEKFQEGVWDGKISLFNKRNKSFPSGLIFIVEKYLKENNISYLIQDQRKPPIVIKKAVLDLGKNSFRDYQEDAINLVKEKTRGILAMGTGAGKTLTSCGIIANLSVYPVIFIVPSISLLKQTAKEFKNNLKPIEKDFKIGIIGGGICDLAMGGINVATYQTLLTAYDKKYSDKKKKVIDEVDNSISVLKNKLSVLIKNASLASASRQKTIQKNINELNAKLKNKEIQFNNKFKIRELVESCQLLMVDETHIAAEIIETISLKAKSAYYKIGLSATPQRLDNQEIRMYGSTGPIIKQIQASELIQRGYLVKPYIYMVEIDSVSKSDSYQELYKEEIVQNINRNRLIKNFSELMHAQGRPTLIMVERVEHGKILAEMIKNSLFVPGKDDFNDENPPSDKELDYRRAQLNRLEKNEIIMIATSWSFTGLDAPKVSCLVLGCSIGSSITVIQQIGRVLRGAPGKENCIILDFKSKNSTLRAQAYSRLKAYTKEKEFEVKVLKYYKRLQAYV